MHKLVFFLLLTAGIAQAHPTVEKSKAVVFNTIEIPPYFSETKPEGGASAFAMREQFKKMGYELQLRVLPFERAKVDSRKNPDVIGYVPCSENDLIKGFELSKTLFESKTLLIQRKDRPIAWNTYDDLKNFKAGQVVGYSLKGDLKNADLNIEYTADDVANLLKVANKHVDFAMINAGMFDYLMKTHPHLKQYVGVLEPNPKVLATVGWAAAFKATPSGRRLKEEFNQKASSTEFKASLEKYLKVYGKK